MGVLYRLSRFYQVSFEEKSDKNMKSGIMTHMSFNTPAFLTSRKYSGLQLGVASALVSGILGIGLSHSLKPRNSVDTMTHQLVQEIEAQVAQALKEACLNNIQTSSYHLPTNSYTCVVNGKSYKLKVNRFGDRSSAVVERLEKSK